MLAATPDEALAKDIERRAHSLLGRMRVEPGRGLFPLVVETADAIARGRIALVGEAAHVVPPIGAQGLNLGCAMPPPSPRLSPTRGGPVWTRARQPHWPATRQHAAPIS